MTQIVIDRVGISAQNNLIEEPTFLTMALSLTALKRICTPEAQVLRKGSVDDDMIVRTITVTKVYIQIPEDLTTAYFSQETMDPVNYIQIETLALQSKGSVPSRNNTMGRLLLPYQYH